MSSPSTPSARQLWSLPPHQFNEWRATNDVPRLFAYLRKMLPGFGKWFDALPFPPSVAARIVPTGELFKGAERKRLLRREIASLQRSTYLCRPISDRIGVHLNGGETEEVVGEFEPYFMWAKRTLGRKRFFAYDRMGTQIVESFRFGSYGFSPPDGLLTEAHLFSDYVVLKLGQTEIGSQVIIGQRNLDFGDLDYLTVKDDFHGSMPAQINYSSCRGLRFQDADVSFLSFHQCAFDEFFVDGSRLQDFQFDATLSWRFDLKARDSSVHKFSFKDTNLVPLISADCEIREFRFEPSSRFAPAAAAKTYRLLRSAYQSTGMRREASDCYYQERVFERKNYFNPYDDPVFSGLAYGASFNRVLADFKAGLLNRSEIPSRLWLTIQTKSKIWLYPKNLYRAISFKLSWIASLFEAVLWGYGERPSRILITAVALIAGYACTYHSILWPAADPKHAAAMLDWVNSAYFSVVTFTTLGYGDILPTSTLLKIIAASEALAGALTMGLIVAGFSNRGRY